MGAALCLNKDLRIPQIFILSLPLPVKCSAPYDQHAILTLPHQAAPEYVYVCECICTSACICVHIYDCMHMYTYNICVTENTTYCYIYDKLQCNAVTARSVFSKHSHDRHTIARSHGLFRVKSLISYSVSITAVLHTSSCSHRERKICTDNIAEKMQRNTIKELKIRECFSMAMSKEWLCFNNQFRCIESCDILHLQNSASLYDHWRLIANIPNKRFLILILVMFWKPHIVDMRDCRTIVV